MDQEKCGVISAQENIYAIWELKSINKEDTKKYYDIEKVIAFHFTCDDSVAYLHPLCLSLGSIESSGSNEQIIFYGTKQECEIEKKRLEMGSNVSNKSWYKTTITLF